MITVLKKWSIHNLKAKLVSFKSFRFEFQIKTQLAKNERQPRIKAIFGNSVQSERQKTFCAIRLEMGSI